jgi:aspartyl protease family protein
MVGAITAAAAAHGVISYSHFQDAQSLRRGESPAQPYVAAVASTDEADGSAAQVLKGADGHYWAEANVNGHEVKFLVDTGATAVSLTMEDARRLGINPTSLEYNARVITANGATRGARVKLDTVSVAGAEVHDVDALVVEAGLHTSLLGMTYLGRLSQFEATPTAMILRP